MIDSPEPATGKQILEFAERAVLADGIAKDRTDRGLMATPSINMAKIVHNRILEGAAASVGFNPTETKVIKKSVKANLDESILGEPDVS